MFYVQGRRIRYKKSNSYQLKHFRIVKLYVFIQRKLLQIYKRLLTQVSKSKSLRINNLSLFILQLSNRSSKSITLIQRRVQWEINNTPNYSGFIKEFALYFQLQLLNPKSCSLEYYHALQRPHPRTFLYGFDTCPGGEYDTHLKVVLFYKP